MAAEENQGNHTRSSPPSPAPAPSLAPSLDIIPKSFYLRLRFVFPPLSRILKLNSLSSSSIARNDARTLHRNRRTGPLREDHPNLPAPRLALTRRDIICTGQILWYAASLSLIRTPAFFTHEILPKDRTTKIG